MISLRRLSQNKKNSAFVAEFDAVTIQHPFVRFLRVFPETMVSIELTDGFEDGEIKLGAIQSIDRGKGYASKALDLLLEMADRHGVRIALDLEPFGEGGLNKKALRQWYESRGFRFDTYGEGRR